MALTDTVIRQAKSSDNEYALKDGDGLFLFIPPTGKKSWHFRFSWAGKQPRMSLGTYPEISLKEARKLRDEARALVAKGIDPRTYRREARQAASVAAENTFTAVFKAWRDFKAKSLKEGRQSTLSQINRIFDKGILPALGKLSIYAVTQADLLEVLGKIEGRGALTTAEKCRTWFNQLFRYARVRLNLPTNPASDLDIVALPQPPVKHNPFLRMPDIPQLLQKLRQYRGNLQTQLGLRLLFLTGVRTGELRLAVPEQFDLKQGLWIIPPEIVKQLQQPLRTEDRDIPPYIVPLSRQAILIIQHLLAEMRPAQRYLLAHRDDLKARISENTLNGALKRMGYQDILTGHGIRATISTALNELGYEKKWVDAQLSHTDPDQVSTSYNHAEYVEPRRRMMQDWADRLDQWEVKGYQPITGHEASNAGQEEEDAEPAAKQAPETVLAPSIDMPEVEQEAINKEVAQNIMTLIARKEMRPQPMLTDLQRERAQRVATFEAPHNLPVPTFAKLVGKSRDQITRDIKARRLLSLNLGNRGHRIPEWQLDPLCQRFIHDILARAQHVENWDIYRAVSEPHQELEGRAPVEAITAENLSKAAQLVFATLGVN